MSPPLCNTLRLSQTLFTFKAQVDVGEVTKDAIIASRSSFRNSTARATRSTTTAGITSAITDITSSAGAAVKMVGAGGEADKANKLFCRLAEMFYERFKKENVIDKRRKADFIKNGIPNAPPLTEDEQNMIAKLMGEVEAMKAKRISGTVNDSVEKFLHRDKKGGAAWGMTVAKMDVAAITLFTEVSKATSYKWLQYLTQSSRSLRLLFFATLVADLAAGHVRQMGRAQKDCHKESLEKHRRHTECRVHWLPQPARGP